MKSSAWRTTGILSLAVICGFTFMFITGASFAKSRALGEDKTPFSISSAKNLLTKPIGQRFYQSAVVPLDLKGVNSLSINGEARLNNEEGFIRITAVDESGNEYLVFDGNMIAPGDVYTIKNHAEETIGMGNVNITSLSVEIKEGHVLITSLSVEMSDPSKTNDRAQAKASAKELRLQQADVKSQKINQRNNTEGRKWVAGKNRLSLLTYEQKKKVFLRPDGKPFDKLPDLKGLDYYNGGSFESTGILIDTAKVNEILGEAPQATKPAIGPRYFHPFVKEGVVQAEYTPAKGQVLVGDIPSYLYYHGCSPTCAGMMLAYWAAYGYPDLFPAGDYSETIASAEHFNDYSLPIDSYDGGILKDRSETGKAHDDNCIADFLKTSFSSLKLPYGFTYNTNMAEGLLAYAKDKGYEKANAATIEWKDSPIQDNIKTEIDAGRPVLLDVDTDGDGSIDHSVVCIGYSGSKYACFNGWDYNIHWFDFARCAKGQSWGIGDATFFNPNGPVSAQSTPNLQKASAGTDPIGINDFTVTSECGGVVKWTVKATTNSDIDIFDCQKPLGEEPGTRPYDYIPGASNPWHLVDTHPGPSVLTALTRTGTTTFSDSQIGKNYIFIAATKYYSNINTPLIYEPCYSSSCTVKIYPPPPVAPTVSVKHITIKSRDACTGAIKYTRMWELKIIVNEKIWNDDPSLCERYILYPVSVVNSGVLIGSGIYPHVRTIQEPAGTELRYRFEVPEGQSWPGSKYAMITKRVASPDIYTPASLTTETVDLTVPAP